MYKAINKRTSEKILLLMFISSICVVFYHSTGYKYFSLKNDCMAMFSMFIVDISYPLCESFALPLFCFLSGFLFFKGINNSTEYGVVIKKKTKSLLIPYFVWNTIWTLFMALISFFPQITSRMTTIKSFNWTLKDVFGGIVLHQYCGVTWYILYIFIFALISPVFVYSLRKKMVSVTLLTGLIFISPLEKIIYCEKILIWPLVFYYFGAFVECYYFDLINANFNRFQRYTGAIVFLLIIFLSSKWRVGYSYSEQLVYLFTRFICLVSAWVGFDFFRDGRIKIYWWMQTYFFLYLFHNIPELCIDKMLRMVVSNTWIGLLINYFGGAILVILLAYFISWILIKKFPILWEFLNGNRKNRRFD